MPDNLVINVGAGLSLGTIFVLLFAFLFQPVTVLSDAQLIAKTKEIRDVQYFLSKYPDSKVAISRDLKKATIAFSFSKQLAEPTSEYPNDIVRERVLAIIYQNSSDSAPEIRLYCIGTPNPLATQPSVVREIWLEE